jgi:DNA-binding MarR family transcriptional regulator
LDVATRVPEPQLAAWRALLGAHAAVVGRAEQALAAAGLPPLSWYDVLWAVRESPRRRARLGELAAKLTISRGGMTKLVDRLEQSGLLRREPSPDDRRGANAVLTRAGEAMLKRMWPTYSAVLAETIGPLSPNQAAAVHRALRAVEARANASAGERVRAASAA